jgi:hypothetical protein
VPASNAPSRWWSNCWRSRGWKAGLGGQEPSIWKSSRGRPCPSSCRGHARHLDLGLVHQRAAAGHQQPRALHLILRNLWDNAIKYTPAGGRIDIALGATEAGWLAVEDSGPAFRKRNVSACSTASTGSGH